MIHIHVNMKKEPLLLAMLQFTYWACYCTFYTFIMLYLTDNGFSGFVCGLIMTILSITNVVVQPIIGYVTDTYLTGKRFLILCFAIAIGMTFLIPATVTKGYIVIVAIVGLAVFDYSEYCIIDSWIIGLKRTKPYIDFPSIRSFGSIGYALTALVFGQIINKLGYDAMFVGHALLLFISVLVMLSIPAAPCMNKAQARKTADASAEEFHQLSMKEAIKILIRIKPYMIFLLSVAMYQFAIRASNTFLPMVVTAVGGNSSDYGLTVFIASILEAFFMFVVSKLVRNDVKITYIYAFGIGVSVIRLLTMGYGLKVGLGFIIFTQVFQAIGTATYLSAFMDYIAKTTPSNLMSTAATLGTALTSGVGCVLGNFLGGILIEAIGLQAYIYICAGVMVCSLLVILPTVSETYQNANYIIRDQDLAE